MTITSETRGGFAVAHLSGSLDSPAGKNFRETPEIEVRKTDLILDMAKVDFMDSAGLAALVLVIRGHKSAGKRCALGGTDPDCRQNPENHRHSSAGTNRGFSGRRHPRPEGQIDR